MSRGPRRIGQKKGDRTRLSLCMIVKNESATLEKCLDHARPYVDEIVIVDTGSTDGTQEIAKRYADVYDEIEWPGSFSEARNYSFDLSSGDFNLWLDGDEYMDDPHGWKRIRKALKDDEVVAAQIRIKNVLPPDSLIAADWMWLTRIVRNDPRLRFEGRVHNQIDDAVRKLMDETGMRALQINAEAVHTGYAHRKEKMKSKYEPRIELLRSEYENPRSEVLKAYYGFQLGVVYFVIERYEEACNIFGEIIYDKLTPQNAFYSHLLAGQSAIKMQDAATALVHCNEMLNISRTEPIAYHTTGLALLLARQPSDGMLMLLEAFGVNEEHKSQARFELNETCLLRVLARICGKMGLDAHERAFLGILEKGVHDRANVVVKIIEALKRNLILAEVNPANA